MFLLTYFVFCFFIRSLKSIFKGIFRWSTNYFLYFSFFLLCWNTFNMLRNLRKMWSLIFFTWIEQTALRKLVIDCWLKIHVDGWKVFISLDSSENLKMFFFFIFSQVCFAVRFLKLPMKRNIFCYFTGRNDFRWFGKHLFITNLVIELKKLNFLLTFHHILIDGSV